MNIDYQKSKHTLMDQQGVDKNTGSSMQLAI